MLVIPQHQSEQVLWCRCLLDSGAVPDTERTDTAVFFLHFTCDRDLSVYTCADSGINHPAGNALDETDILRMFQASTLCFFLRLNEQPFVTNFRIYGDASVVKTLDDSVLEFIHQDYLCGQTSPFPVIDEDEAVGYGEDSTHHTLEECFERYRGQPSNQSDTDMGFRVEHFAAMNVYLIDILPVLKQTLVSSSAS